MDTIIEDFTPGKISDGGLTARDCILSLYLILMFNLFSVKN